ncbi:MAG: TonB-dependent receptor [Rikenellaceae bacterium]
MEKNRHTIVALRMLFRSVLCFAVLMLCGVSAMAQSGTISGCVVSTADGEPILGATVIIDGTLVGTTTDIDGNFEIPNAPTSGNLIVSYIGFTDQTVAIVAGKNYTIELSEDSKQIDEVVVVGYGTMRKKEVTGAVARLSSDDLTTISSSDVSSALQGQIAGVNVTASSGEPGSSAVIQIRGLSSISGSSTPLYVVDGVPQSGDPGLSSSEIESIDVLKDAASAAIYGTRGASGVILITTKKGKEGDAKISFDAYYGVQNITSDLEMNDTGDYMYGVLLYNRLSAPTSGSTDDHAWTAWQAYDASVFNDSNLYDIVTNNNAAIQNYSASVSGGANGVTYSVQGNYFNQEGLIINSGFERYNMRGDVNVKKGNLTINANISARAQEKWAPGGNLLLYSYGYLPTAVEIDPNMDITSGAGAAAEALSMANALANILETNETSVNAYTANIYLAYDLPYNFQLSSRVGLGSSSTRFTSVSPLFEVYDSDGNLQSSSNTRSGVEERSMTNESTTWETMLNWNQTYGLHEVRFTGVFSTEEYTYDRFDASIYDLVTTELSSLNVGSADQSVDADASTTTLVGMLARAQYNYDSRFMLSASIRRDASSRFGADNRWGMFPSISGGWNVSEEKFWEPLAEKINNFKIRASYGTTGNQSFGDYAFQTTISQDLDYVYGTGSNQTFVSGATQTSFSNANIGWETTVQSNYGVDLGFFNNTLTISADYYNSSKRDMLFPLAVPASAGAGGTTVILNVGDMTNQGVEFAAQYRNNINKKVFYSINATFSTNNNTVTSLGGDTDMYYFTDGLPLSWYSSDKVTVVKEGYEAGAFFMMPTDGIINTEEKLAKYQAMDSDYRMGDLAYVDSNGDGVIDDSDRVYCGSGTPDYEIGLNYNIRYKNFDLYMNWYSSIGNEVINGTEILTLRNRTSTSSVYQWSEYYPESSIPTYRGTTHDNYRPYADIWVEDGSFIRLKNVSLGYSLPKKVLDKLNITKLRVYVAADNIWTLTGYSGYDPEVGSNGLSKRGLDLGTYPISRQIRGGVQFGF